MLVNHTICFKKLGLNTLGGLSACFGVYFLDFGRKPCPKSMSRTGCIVVWDQDAVVKGWFRERPYPGAPTDWLTVITIAAQVASGMVALHEVGVVHGVCHA
jgi:hypothetical protein